MGVCHVGGVHFRSRLGLASDDEEMGILEKLRPQPRWKHADPGVRSAAVYELGPEEADALLALAREDADSRASGAAVGRLSEVDVLGEIARTDPDEDVRSEAICGLAGLAAETKEPDRASEVVRQLLMLGRVKEVVVVARENTNPLVRGAVVDLIDDSKSLGSVSRHAQDGSTRLRALARLTDPEEILNVALKGEHTDSAVSALERIQDPAALSAIAQRGRNKVAARRARTKLRVPKEAAQPSHDAPVRMTAADKSRGTELLHQAEALVATSDPDEASASLAAVRLAWAEFQADVEVDEPIARQFEAASDAARGA